MLRNTYGDSVDPMFFSSADTFEFKVRNLPH